MTSSAKWHVSAVLHCSSSFRNCCIFGLLPWNVKSSSERFQASCCSPSLSSLSSQGGAASAVLVFEVQMLCIGMMMWTDRTHVLAAQVQETTIRVSCDTCHKTLTRDDLSSDELDTPTYLKTRVTLSLSLRSLCVSDCHALYVLALHGVVPGLAIRLHASFSEECLHHGLHVFSRSSRNPCSSRSMAVGSSVLALCFGLTECFENEQIVSQTTRCSV